MKYTAANTALNPPLIAYDTTEFCFSDAQNSYIAAPAVIMTPCGRIWVASMQGGVDEGPEHYIALDTSDDEGKTWQRRRIVIHVDPEQQVRLHDQQMWKTREGRIFLSWSQSYQWWDGRGGVWIAEILDPDSEHPRLSTPCRAADGVMCCAPYVRPNGDWLLPIACWKGFQSRYFSKEETDYSSLYISRNNGLTYEFLGRADVPGRNHDEHLVVERQDGSLMMIVRTIYGIGRSFSFDGGRTWTPGEPYMKCPSARSFMCRLPSGRFLRVGHKDCIGQERCRMAAFLSEDEGETWPYSLMLDERENVSYSSGTLLEDGRILIVHDRERYQDKEIIMHFFREEDILAGRIVTDDSKLKLVAVKSYGTEKPSGKSPDFGIIQWPHEVWKDLKV